MRSSPEVLPAVLHYLKSIGVHVHHWKAKPNQEKVGSASVRGLFGVPLHLLPLSKHADGVPQFLVDACDLLRPHLHMEGLFRKCGSMTRIKALKTRLESGENCLEMALPCDVATLVKQFLRELPEPLIPLELQRPLCDVQQRKDSDLQGPLTVLLTCLFPQRSILTLRYLFTFLQEVATRSAQNKMDVANLAIVFAPNLFPSELCSKLDSKAEEQLQRQVSIIQAMIDNAPEIGTVPQVLLGKVQVAFSDPESTTLSPFGSKDTQDRTEDLRRWRHRRSVGDIVTETLSKLKSGRVLCPVPYPKTPDGAWREGSPSWKKSFNSKRKASDDASCVPELSVKKRKSILDSSSSDPSDDGDPLGQPRDAGSRSPVPVFSSGSLSNPVSEEANRPGSPHVPPVTIQKKRSCRNKPQRKCSFRATPGGSPSPLPQKGRKSLRIFFRSSKYPVEQLLPVSDKAAEPSGWLLMKKMVTEGMDGPTSQPRWAQQSSYKLKECEKGFPNPPSTEDPYILSCKDLCLDGVHQEPHLDVMLRSRRLLDETEDLVVKDNLPLSPPLGRHRALRRSLSWPEDLSARDAAEQKATAFYPDEPLISPEGPETQLGLSEPSQPDMDVLVTGMGKLEIPTAHVTPTDVPRVGCPMSGPKLWASKPEPPEAHVGLYRHLNEVPKIGLKSLSLTFHQAKEGLNPTSGSATKRKTGRRFGRSVSHESNLPLQSEETHSGSSIKTEMAAVPHKSPLQSFKAYGQQIFLTRKHIALSFTGLRRKKEVLMPNAQDPEVATAISKEPIVEHCSSTKFS